MRIETLEQRDVPSGSPPVATPIPRQTVNEDASALTLNLNTFFTDPESDTLTYSVVQTNTTGLVSTSVVGGNLILNFAPNKYGYSYLRVTANDGTGTTTTAFEVLVREQSDLTNDTATTSKASPLTINVLANDGAVDTARVAEAANVQVVQNDTGNVATSVTVTTPQLSGDLTARAGSNRGDYNMQVGPSATDDVAGGMLLSSSRENGRVNPGDTLTGTRHTTPAVDSDASGYFLSINDAPNGGEVNVNVSAAYFAYAQGWLGAWGVNASGTNGGVNDVLRNATPNAGFTIGTTAANMVRDLSGGRTQITLPGISSQTDGLLLTMHGKNEDNFSLAQPNADGSWQINIKDNGTSGAGLEQDPPAFVYLPKDMPGIVSGRILGDGTVQMASGNYTLTKTGTGTYTLSIPGQTPTTGVLILSPETSAGAGEDNIVSYAASGSDFIIQTRDIVNTSAEPALEDVGATTRVASFAFIPFLSTPAIRTTNVADSSNTPNVSNLGATLTLNADGTVSYDPSSSTTIQNAAPGSILTDTFTYTTTNLTGQTSSATVTVTIAEGNVVDKVGSTLAIKSTPGINSSLALSSDGTTFTFTDPGAIFSLTQAALDAGFTGVGTNTLTGPVTGLSLLSIDLGNGDDQILDLNALAANVQLSSTGALTIGGVVSTTGDVTVTTNSIVGTALGLLQAANVTLNPTTTLGTDVLPVRTQATNVRINGGSGASFVAELDGANVRASGAGNVTVMNLLGTLNVPVNIILGGANLSLSSADALTLNGNLSTGAGTITLAANTDGAGTEGYDQKAATLTTSNLTTNALSIQVNTAGGGTGSAIIGQGIVGSDTGGGVVVNSHGGNIVWSSDPSYAAFTASQLGISNGGSNTQTLRAYTYDFQSTGNSGAGSDDRPLQLDNFGTNNAVNAANNLTASVGSGGLYATVWDVGASDLTVGNVSAQGAGNIRLVTANSSGHNMWVNGNITTGSGNIFLGIDDQLELTANGSIGDASFSGTVWLQGNRDLGTAGQTLTMNAASSITTSNTTNIVTSGRNSTTQAVYIDMGGDAGTPSTITLANITTGDGGRIVVNAIPNGITAEAGRILTAGASNVLNAGPTGTVDLISGITVAAAADGIGTTALPVQVAGGNVVVTANNSNVNVTGANSTAFTVTNTVTGSQTGAGPTTALSTTTGTLTVAGPVSNVNAGPITLTSTGSSGGIAINNTFAGSTTGNLTLNAGSNPATLNTALTLGNSQTLSVTAANGLAIGSTGKLAGTGATGNATPLSVQAGGLVAPADTAVGTLNVGATTFAANGRLRLDLNSTSSFDVLNVTGALDLTNAVLDLNITGTFNVGDAFTIITNDDAEAITGQFVGGTSIRSVNDPRYLFTVNYAAGDGNDVAVTVSEITVTSLLHVTPDGQIVFASKTGTTNNLSVTQTGTQLTVNDTTDVITLSAEAQTAGWTGSGTNTVTGPATAPSIAIALNDGADVLAGLNVTSLPVFISGTGSVELTGGITSGSSVSISGVTDIVGTGMITAPTVNLNVSNGIGTDFQRIPTTATTITAVAGNTGIHLLESDGATITATASGSGDVNIMNTAGTLNLTATSATGSIIVANNAGTLNVAGPVIAGGGNINLSSADALVLNANVATGSGLLTLAANTDGVGSDNFDPKAASITTGNATGTAASITVNTATGGTGNAILGVGSIGSNSGGALTVNAFAGNIVWSDDPAFAALTDAQRGITSGGSNGQVLRAYTYNLSGVGIGTDARPLQLDNFGVNTAVSSPANFIATAGEGGIYATVWDSAGNRDLTLGNITAQGSGNIRIGAANAGGHNLWVDGNVTTGTGSIMLFADDEFYITATGLVGGPTFAGTVTLVGNNDAGNGQSINMAAGAAIVTSNTSANAVVLNSQSGNGSAGASDLTPQGGVVLTNITVGDGGTITVNAAAGASANRQGTIVQRTDTLLDAGPTGTVVLLARAVDTTGVLNTGNIGANGDTTTLQQLPITVNAGTVQASTNGTVLGNTGHISVVNMIGGTFNATTTGNGNAAVVLSTTAGALTVGMVQSSGGAVAVTGAEGVVVTGTLGSATTGTLAVNGPLSGTGNIVLGTANLTLTQATDSTFDGTISGGQAVTKAGTGTLNLTNANTYGNGTTVSAGGLSVQNPTGSATGAAATSIADGATLRGNGTTSGALTVSGSILPGSTPNGAGQINTGSLAFGASGVRTVAFDLNDEIAGTEYDQLNVTGTVNLAGAELSITSGPLLGALLGTSFVIIANDDTDAISGTFTGYAEGSTITSGSRTYTVSYAGGDGNDVILTVTQIVSGPPVNTVPATQTTNEDVPVVFAVANANAISVADPEFGGPLQVQLTVTNGTLTLATMAGVTFTVGDGTDDATMTFKGRIAALNAALNGLMFTPAADFSGSALLTITTDDQNGTGNGVQSDTDTVTITINAANDAPTFVKGADQTVNEDAAPQTVSGWATSVSSGPADEASQTLTFLVTTDNDDLFSVLPAINSTTGTLTYTLAANANGTATVSVQLQDSGDTANGGANTSATQTFVITANAVNDVPSFVKGADQTVNEDAGTITVPNWATSISKGPANESDQTLLFLVSTNNDALFTTLPSIDPMTGTLSYTLAPDANGAATVSVQLQDNGGTLFGGVDTSATQTFVITANAVNDVPSFVKGADQTVNEDAAPQTVTGWATSISKGPANESDQTLLFLVSTNNDALFTTLPSIDPMTGTLTYTLAPDANGTATVSVQLQDSGTGTNTAATQTFTIAVAAVNDAPVLTPPTPTFNPIAQNSTGGAGQTVASILSGTDPDAAALQGIALVGMTATVSEGVWQFTTDGGTTWTNLGPLSATSALLLRDTDRLRFVPATGYVGTVSITYRAWDQTTGTVGTTVDVSMNGGTTAFSGTTVTTTLTVGLPLTNVPEDTKAPVGDRVSTMVLPFVADPDLKAKRGIAIIATTGSELGTWQYFAGGWKPLVASQASALLLAETAKVRFVPFAGVVGQASLVYHAWDQTFGKSGTTVNLSGANATGGGTAFSETSLLAFVTVTPVNDAPVLDIGGEPLFTRVAPGAANPAGDLVADLLATSATDAEGDSLSMAISKATGNGTWQFQLDGSTTWTPLGKVSTKASKILEANDRVRFLPNLGFVGAAKLTYKVTDGVLFSKASETGSLIVDAFMAPPANNAPVLDDNIVRTLTTITEDAQPKGNLVSLLVDGAAVTDANSGALRGIAIVGLTGTTNGQWQYSANGKSWKSVGLVSEANALLLRATDFLRFLPKKDFSGTASVTYHAWDQTRGTSGAYADLTVPNSTGGRSAFSILNTSANVSITAVNDAPVLEKVTPLLTSVATGATDPAGDLVSTVLGTALTDVDTVANLLGMAVTAASGKGTWQFSTDNGTSWTVLGVVSTKAPKNLAATDRLRFVPDATFTGVAKLTFKGWDGLLTSVGSGTASLTVNNVDDRPVLNTKPNVTLTPVLVNDQDADGDRVADLLGTNVTDADTNAVLGIAITAADSKNGVWQFSTDGGTTWTALGVVSSKAPKYLAGTDRVRFVPNTGFVGVVKLSYKAWDAASSNPTGPLALSSATETATVTVNTAPSL